MAITKMRYVTLQGPSYLAKNAYEKCISSTCFQAIEQQNIKHSARIVSGQEETMCFEALERVRFIISELNLEENYLEELSEDKDEQKTVEEISKLEKAIIELSKKKKKLSDKKEKRQQEQTVLSHIQAFSSNLDDLRNCKYVNVKFGKIPNGSEVKLKYYEEKNFVYFTLDSEDGYTWCAYTSPSLDSDEIDNLFASLYFEEIKLPEDIGGTPSEAMSVLKKEISTLQTQLDEIENKLTEIKEQNKSMIDRAFCHFTKKSFEISTAKKYIFISNDTFTINGFVPSPMLDNFSEIFNSETEISLISQPPDASGAKTPVLLRNNRFFEPFENFVTMYGYPSYNEIDATPFVAIIYSLLFGIMFGDVGQGMLISLLGLLFYKWKKAFLGRIMMRIGLFSAAFGFAYGSVFGFENLLDPMYKSIGLDGKPLDVFSASGTNFVIFGAIAVGIAIIIASIILNIVVSFKTHKMSALLFSSNGIFGLIFYTAVVLAVVLLMMFNVNVLSPIFILLCIVLPLAIMFLQKPLTDKLEKRKKTKDKKEGFILESFFEMFETLLGYITNTMSFLRVGGFVLSHAGMMSVVFTLSEMIGGSGSIAVIIFGNLFVIALEGLIVGIQVLRLEFYEMFSHFFEGDGEPFTPLGIYTEQKNIFYNIKE